MSVEVEFWGGYKHGETMTVPKVHDWVTPEIDYPESIKVNHWPGPNHPDAFDEDGRVAGITVQTYERTNVWTQGGQVRLYKVRRAAVAAG